MARVYVARGFLDTINNTVFTRRSIVVPCREAKDFLRKNMNYYMLPTQRKFKKTVWPSDPSEQALKLIQYFSSFQRSDAQPVSIDLTDFFYTYNPRFLRETNPDDASLILLEKIEGFLNSRTNVSDEDSAALYDAYPGLELLTEFFPLIRVKDEAEYSLERLLSIHNDLELEGLSKHPEVEYVLQYQEIANKNGRVLTLLPKLGIGISEQQN